MLKPAQLYRDELNRKLIEHWYDPKCKYYFLDCQREFNPPDNTEWRRDFVCVNSKNEVVGYFAYHHDDVARSLSQFGLISFTADNNVLLIRDCINHINQLVKEGLHRVEWWAVDGNPANVLYDKLIKRYGGVVAGRMRDCHYFGGEYHGSIMYEILF